MTIQSLGLNANEEKIILDIIVREARDCDVFVFGSRFSGTDKDYSDLDLAFALPSGARLPLTRLDEIKYAFSESDLVFRVDVLDYNGTEEYFRKIIDSGSRKIYQSKSF